MAELWLRNMSLTIGGVVGRQYTSSASAPRKMTFRVNNNLAEQPNSAKFELYNLSENHRSFIEGELTNKKVILEVSHGNDALRELFRGDIYRAFTTKKGPNLVTEIESGDGVAERAGGLISVSFGPNNTHLTFLANLTAALGMGVDVSAADMAALSEQVLHGRSYHGDAFGFIRALCRSTGHEWSIQRGVLQIMVENSSLKASAIYLDSETGLIGRPSPTRSKIRYESRDASGSRRRRNGQQIGGVEIKSILNPELVPGALVQLNSSSATGLYACRDITHRGDTMGPTWTSKAKIYEYE